MKRFYKRLNQPMGMDIRCHKQRICPFRINENHDVHFDPEWDWYVQDNAPAWFERVRMMHARSLVIKEQLQMGNPVQFRVWGQGMYPRVHKGDCCIFEPVVCLATLQVGDIVFCQLEQEGKLCAHEISYVPKQSAASAQDDVFDGWLTFHISTQYGKWIGTCLGNNIYGRLVEMPFL